MGAGHWSLLLLVGASLVGCGSKPEPKPDAPPTRLSATISAAQDLNPDLSGRPSPVVLRVYELKQAASFNGADFQALYQQPQAALGADLLAGDEMLLQPGETRALEKTTEPAAGFVGFVAAFQNLDHAVWRVLLPLTANADLKVTIKLGREVISAEVSKNEHDKGAQ